MNDSRKDEIIQDLMSILNDFKPNEEEQLTEPTMFWLISKYNQTGKNAELIGGDWVVNNCPEPLKSLP